MTSDQQQASALREHYRAEPEPGADLDRVTRAVLKDVHETPQQRRRWWPFQRRVARTQAARDNRRLGTMFTATRLVVAAAIVAPFSGFLLAGILTTQRGDEMAPAAVTETPSPVTTGELLSGMVTEEVEPGVLRVVNDGVRGLSSADFGYPGYSVDVTPDGGVWLSAVEGRHGLFRLGEEPTFDTVAAWPPYMEVAPDGSLWALSEDSILSFDGEGWTPRATTNDSALRFGSLAIGPDGTVWATDWTGMLLLRLEDDGTLTTIEAWADVYAGVVSPDELAVSPDGDVWLVGMVRGDGPDAEALLRFDGSEWEVIPGPESFLNHPLGNSLDVGPDGTLWVNTSNGYSGADGVGGLARFDGSGWTAFTEADGVQDWGAQGFIATDLLAVASDGSLWMNGAPDGDGCGGVAHYDGTTWDSYLVESCVHDLAIAPDGSVWVRANAYRRDSDNDRDITGPVSLYVIDLRSGALAISD